MDSSDPDLRSRPDGRSDSAPSTPWQNVPLTQLRRPRLRADTVPRETLVGVLCAAALQRRVCLVQAPGGYGKTTLLSQVAGQCDATARARSVWLSLSAGENDVNRLVVLLLCALSELQLQWPVEPQLLASQVQGGGSQAEAAVAVIVNALGSWQGERLLLVLDDLQHVVEPSATALLGALIDRLPPAVAVLIGARSVTGLPLARWRLRQELAELCSQDLAFTAEDARALARQGAMPAAGTDAVEHALRRSAGWAAGLQMLLAARAPGAAGPQAAAGAERALFDYFAEESLAGLPAPLQQFLTECSILDELTPDLCRAVTGREDALDVLLRLDQRSLFLTALDEARPVLKLHDLFAEFLRQRLARRGPAALRALHARAASAEQPMRAVAHWLAAQDWAAAVRQMAAVAPGLLAEGGTATVARWLSALPEPFARQDADALFLQALVASHGWDFAAAIGPMDRAMQAYAEAGRVEQHLFCAVLLPRLCLAVGRLDQGAKLLAHAESLPLNEELQLLGDAARFWLGAACEPAACAGLLESVASRAPAHPGLLPALVENLNVPHFHGLRGVRPAMLRLRSMCQQLQAHAAHPPWQLRAMGATTWPELWRGDRAAAEAALAEAAPVQAALSVIPVMRFNTMAETAFAALARGDTATAVATQRQACEQMSRISPAFSATWTRVNQFGLAHRLWAAGDLAGLAALWHQIAHPRSAFEYPVIDTQLARFAGHMAWMDGDLERADNLFCQAVALQQQGSMPTLCGDVRPSLAALRLARGDTAGAWAAFAPLLDEMRAGDCVGALLMEPLALRSALLGLVPEALRAHRDVATLIERVAQWQPQEGVRPGPLQSLSSREAEVLEQLATGASNQHIAERLHISVHTVKRHVVNVCQKLGCTTRGQAAARWHAARHARVQVHHSRS